MERRKTAHISMRLDPAVKAAAEKTAAKDRRPLSSLIEVMLADRCKEHLPAEDRPMKRGGRK